MIVAYNTCCSRVVPHPSTRQAQARLTSEFWWFRVHSYWYRRKKEKDKNKYKNSITWKNKMKNKRKLRIKAKEKRRQVRIPCSRANSPLKILKKKKKVLRFQPKCHQMKAPWQKNMLEEYLQKTNSVHITTILNKAQNWKWLNEIFFFFYMNFKCR